MNNKTFPITPSPELMRQWLGEFFGCSDNVTCELSDSERYLATQAARWAADQELEACVEWLQDPDLNVDTYKLRAVRRSKPPSLKKQALEALKHAEEGWRPVPADCEIIRRALEQLDD